LSFILKATMLGLALEVSLESGTAVRTVAGAARADLNLVSDAVRQLSFVTSFDIFLGGQ